MKLAATLDDFMPFVPSPSQAVKQFEGTGFRYLDYTFFNEGHKGSAFMGDDWARYIDDAGETAAKLGMRFVQAHSPNYNHMNPNGDHETGMLATIRSIEACGRLGIHNLVVHPGASADYMYPQDMEAYCKANRPFYEALFPAMEKNNVNVLIENSAERNVGGCCFFMSGQDMASFVEYMGHPLLNACWDTGHANLRETSQYDDICTMGKCLKALHVQDNFGLYDEHFAPLMGTTDMDAIMQGLLKIDYQGYFTFETQNLLATPGGWPHARKTTPGIKTIKLNGPSLELRRKAEALLFEIGKYILSQYDCFEE